jgi:hypothetical protein
MRTLRLGVLALLLFGLGRLDAGQPSLRAEKTVKYRTGESIALDVRVGPVKVSTVTFTVGGPGGIGAAVKAKMSRLDPNTQTMLTVAFDAENPESDEWLVNYTIEFLNAKGEVIDRFTTKDSYEAQAKTSSFEHATLKAVLPLVDKVRMKFQAEAS